MQPHSDWQMPQAKSPRIGVLTGYWSTNIGNAFFQLGAQYALEQALPGAHVFLIGDQPGYWNTKEGNPANALDYVKHLDLDAVVVLGPYVRPEMTKITADMLKAQHAKGAKIIVMAAGMMKYDKDTIANARRLMADCPPFVFTTRDTETYDALGDLAEHAFDGIDVATFISDLFPPINHDLGDYMVLNFDQIPEPTLAPTNKFGTGPRTGSFSHDGTEWSFKQPKFRTEMSYKSRAYLFAEAALGIGRKGPATIDGMTVIRTDHRYNPFMLKKSYKLPMTYAGDVPQSYLNLYAHSKLTISNRVHACVATVSYGNAAMLFTRSPRAYLLKRLGLNTIKDEPNRVDMVWLRQEKTALLNWLGQTLGNQWPDAAGTRIAAVPSTAPPATNAVS